MGGIKKLINLIVFSDQIFKIINIAFNVSVFFCQFIHNVQLAFEIK